MVQTASPSRPAVLLVRMVAAQLLALAFELAFVGLPLYLSSRGTLDASGIAKLAAPMVAGLLVLAVVVESFSLRAVLLDYSTKLRGEAFPPERDRAAETRLRRLPWNSGLLHLVAWLLAAAMIALLLRHRQLLDVWALPGLLAMTLICGGAATSARGILLDLVLGPARRVLLPNQDPIRAYARRYRWRLVRVAHLVLGISYCVLLAIGAAFTEIGARRAAVIAALALAALLLPAVLWLRALRRRTTPVEAYFQAVLRTSSPRGPARDEPAAVTAFKAAQALPYRLAGYASAGALVAAVAVIAVARTRLGVDASSAARLFAAAALLCLAGGLYELLLLREVLRPLLGMLGSRHRIPVNEVRSPVGLRVKVILFFVSVSVFASGLVLLFALSPAHSGGAMVLAMALGVVLSLGMVLLIARELVAPISALESRSEEMARGELARPVPPSGEADELGRLTFAFEEMRRGLRDKLRNTESINIDLEREVRRRTEVLEQRNSELREALEKLRRAQDDLVRSEKLASMGRLVAGIAHEINNPVNAVINTIGPLQELLGQLKEVGDLQAVVDAASDAGEMLGVIQRGATRTKAIVQALHNYSRGDQDTVREVNLARSVDDTLDLLRHRLKGVQVVKEIGADARISGFAGQIDQVIMNLVTNAAQALGGQGTIRITVAGEGDDVVLTVTDDGPGIPAAILPRIFDPFFTTKDVGEGSGLGLSIVHGIVDRHGGRIDVESELNKGTTFRIHLPRKSSLPLGTVEEKPATPATGAS